MRDFLNMHVPSTGSDYLKFKKLMQAMIDNLVPSWKYNAFKTYSAAESFDHRQGNCLSYALMLVVLGRELGLELYFNEVQIPPSWNIQAENTFVLFRHVNVLAKVDHKLMILDLELEDYDSSYPHRKITDIVAEAHYYNNRGTDYLNTNENK